MKAVNQLKTFLRLLEEYPGDEALHRFLPVFFRQNKQMGSTDRRIASRLIYNYYRLGKSIAKEAPQERLLVAEFLCNQNENSFLNYFKPEYARQVSLKLDEKLALVKADFPDFDLDDVFPFGEHLSAGIDKQAFLRSHFLQPDLFIRIWPGFENEVKVRLAKYEIAFREEWEGCLALPNGTRLDALFPDKKPYEVQDRSSQLTGRFFKPGRWESWWDACAASGGKSLMLAAQQREMKLVVSDMRENILRNLDERFQAAGVRSYQKKILDLT
ncbi:MAG: RsmB/NOP family class I SAM-dependent RNA methyltransferase, partial [Mucilaginibacter polytrichastri]|nr:RsmB/NOP family class I SAM-dependent RNA methyltransferase [Mucilaginibacter polytrichastri]